MTTPERWAPEACDRPRANAASVLMGDVIGDETLSQEHRVLICGGAPLDAMTAPERPVPEVCDARAARDCCPRRRPCPHAKCTAGRFEGIWRSSPTRSVTDS